MAARRKFLFDQEQVVSFCKDFKVSEESSISTLKVEENELERRWLQLVENYGVFMTGDENADDAESVKMASTKYKEAYKKYRGCKSIISDTVASRQLPRADESIRNDTTMNQPSHSSLKLPPCDTPPFEGGYSKWPAFRDIFWAVFGTHPELSAAQKLYHLRSKTRGEAYQIVKKFDLVDENFNLAWDALKTRYENKRILVHQQMKQLFGTPAAQTETPKTIRSVQNGIDYSLSIFQSYKVETEKWDPILIHLCSTKLPEETLRAWEDSLSNHKELPTWSQMSKFLSTRIEIIETISDYRKSSSKEYHGSQPKSQAFHSQVESEKPKYNCKKCNQNHSLRDCHYFKSLSVNDRINYVYANKYCANCLSSTHFKSHCTSEKSCRKCKQRHHTMLHLEGGRTTTFPLNRGQQGPPISMEPSTSQNSSSAPAVNNYQTHVSQNRTFTQHREQQGPSSSMEPSTSQNSWSAPAVANFQTHFSHNEGTTILPTALIDIAHEGELFTIRALLDAGSEKSFISKHVQQILAIPVNNYNSQISGLGGTIVGNSNSRCFINLRSKISDFNIKIKAIVVSKIARFLPSKHAKIENLPDLNDLKLADPNFMKPAAIDMIIGSDYLPYINLDGIRSNIGKTLEARESHFGWYVSGPLPAREVNMFSTMVSTSEDIALHEQMKKFWELEEVPRTHPVSEDDLFCENFFQNTTYRESDGRYVVRLPFRAEFPKDVYLGHSRNMAFAQYHRMEKTLDKTPDLKSQYQAVLQEYLELDHMETSNCCETSNKKQSSFFLPHHAVLRPDSKSTKVRVVFNGSKKTTSGFSLNDVLYPGPILQADLMTVVLNWRYYKYVFTGDIQKMYRQILIHPEDRKFQQIVFRPDKGDAVQQFQLKTVTFGVNCAPFLALRTLQQLSEDCQLTKPSASEILKHEIYVDDVLSGGHTLEEAKTKQKQLIEVLNSASLPLKKLTANDSCLLEHLAREDRLDEEFLKIDDSSTIKTLGIRWNAMQDIFYYDVQQVTTSSATKRQILALIARLFDPLGWLGPMVILSKILMQQLWEAKVDWDESIPPHLLIKWKAFVQNLPNITALKIPRWVSFSPGQKVQIHGFCDASEKAYCAAIYIRTVDKNNKFSSHLLLSKTRVAPLKRTTIPKLELCGAELLTDLIQKINTSTFNNFDLFMWTDSSIVLGWLQKNPQTLKTFVANRVTKILNVTSEAQWKHIKTEENPADLGTRGCGAQDLVQNSLWWHGPYWLLQPIERWPKPRTFDPTDLETKRISTFHLECQEDLISKFSSLLRALRVICYVFRFTNSLRKKPSYKSDIISTEEIIFVKNRLIMLAQQNHYPREYECLINKNPINRKSNILTLTPFLDKEGLLRVGGRLENAGLSYNERHPVIIPDKSHFALLFVRYTHQILLHAEYNIMLRAVRQGFYIPRLKNIIRKCIRECKTCTIYKRHFQTQIMAALPPERVNFSLPFTYTGVDFAGPFNLKSSTLRNSKLVKGYAAVFVCFSTRAVHLEVSSDLSAEAFLAAFARFTGRRGLPKTMFSDNGRNFVGASHKLLQEHNTFLKSAEKSLQEKYGMHGFSWSFIPPYAPHMGGLWEAAVKSMKSHLKKITNNLSFTFEEFTTLLIRIEAILNSRPISPISQDPGELLPLTAGHLLRGAPLIALPETLTQESEAHLPHLTRWKRLKTIQHIFSKRWKAEYITELQRRFKWKTTKNNLQENDFIIVKQDNLPPTEWRMGRITKVIYGKDNNVRVAEIKTQDGTIVRPIVKLCVLPTEQNNQTQSSKSVTSNNTTTNDQFLKC